MGKCKHCGEEGLINARDMCTVCYSRWWRATPDAEKGNLPSKMIETRREDGTLVGSEVSRQRRYQIRQKQWIEQKRKRYYEQHKEEEVEKATKWNREHPERKKETNRKYWKKKVELLKLNQNKNMPYAKSDLTMEGLQFVVDNYGVIPVEEIAKKLGTEEKKIKSWASILRRSGVDIRRAHGGKYGSIIRTYIEEYMEKHPERKEKATIKEYPPYAKLKKE